MPSFVLWTKCKSGPLCKYRLLLPEPGWTRLVRCLLPTVSKLKSKQSAVVHVPYLAVTSLSWTLGRCGSPRCSQKFLSVPPFRKYRRKLHLILSTDGYLQIHLTSWRPLLPPVRGTGTNAPILSHRLWLCTAIIFIRVIMPPSTELPATVQHALANALSCLAARMGLKVCVACSHRPPDKAPLCCSLWGILKWCARSCGIPPSQVSVPGSELWIWSLSASSTKLRTNILTCCYACQSTLARLLLLSLVVCIHLCTAWLYRCFGYCHLLCFCPF